jgi:hypothetical protein
MTATTHTSTRFEELMSREANGISVSLLWNRHEDSVVVCVFDASTDTSFELDVEDARPLDVFNHPYAYAAFRGIDTAPALEQQAEEPVAA